MSNVNSSTLPRSHGGGVQLSKEQFNSYNEVLMEYGMHVLYHSKKDGEAPLNKKSVFVEMGFSGDDDGLASTVRINAEVNDSTGGRVSCVLQDHNGPNRWNRVHKV
ncbi:hypothetical protein KIN20_022266 [Parelaphostrongylus tenuis]|uniref:Uncharacterized protein n=1 Tax=Parelaphostrongylus tenuis TaxID=148309 RepID=A0AAD5MQE6_PARTN|nr:hypothetical protein KIN20_022266 [Parelaphostrongylus tenuis]